MSLTSWFLPVFVGFIVLFGLIKGVPVFNCFTEGAKNGINTFISLMPSLVGLMTAISLLNASGGIEMLENIFMPVAALMSFPKEIVPLCIISPISGSGSLSVFQSILTRFGPDSAAGRVASVISGSSETTFYAVTVYFGAVNVKNTGWVIPCALLGDITGFIAAAISVKLLF